MCVWVFFFFCDDVCFTEDMFTVSGSGCEGDLDDKNSPSSYILLLYCMHMYIYADNFYKYV